MSNFDVNVRQTQSGSAVRDTLADLKMIKVSQADANKVLGEAGDASKKAGDGFEAMGRKAAASQNIATGLLRTLKGDMSGIVQIGQGLRGIWASLGAGVAVVGAGIAGWKIGLQAQAFLWDKIVGSVKDMGAPVATTREEFEKLAQVKLDALTEQVATITKSLEDALSLISKAEARAGKVRSAKMEEEIASVPEGPGKALAVAGIRKKYGEEEIESDRADATAKQTVIKQNRADLVAVNRSMQSEIADAEDYQETVKQKMAGAAPSEGKALVLKQVRNKVAALHAKYDPAIAANEDTMFKYGQDLEDINTDKSILPIRERTLSAEYAAAQRTKEKEDSDYRREIATEMVARTHAREKSDMEADLAGDEDRAAALPKQIRAKQVEAQKFKAMGASDLAGKATAEFKEMNQLYRDLLAEIKNHKAVMKNGARTT